MSSDTILNAIHSRFYVPIEAEGEAAILSAPPGRYEVFQCWPIDFYFDTESGRVAAISYKQSDLKRVIWKVPLEPVRRVEFGRRGPPFYVAINGRKRILNALPYAVLRCVFGRYRAAGARGWPKGTDLAEKCGILRKQVDPRYRESGRSSERKWAGWLDQSRRELAAVFPEISPYDLLPDGKKSRQDALCPQVAPNCEIVGAATELWAQARQRGPAKSTRYRVKAN